MFGKQFHLYQETLGGFLPSPSQPITHMTCTSFTHLYMITGGREIKRKED